MATVLIRDVPEPDVQSVDRHAERLGVSRAEYLRRLIRQDADRSARPVTAEELRQFSEQFPDLGDQGIMRDAWS